MTDPLLAALTTTEVIDDPTLPTSHPSGRRACSETEARRVADVARGRWDDDERALSLGAPGVLWMAMRYALGRHSYAVGEACDALVENVDKIRPWQAGRMADEIDDHLVLVAEARRYAPDLDDRWRQARDELRVRSREARDG